jgi:hypothetical protein
MWHSCGSFLIITVITKEVELMKGKFKTWLNKVLFVQETEEEKKLREQQLRELDELLEEIRTPEMQEKLKKADKIMREQQKKFPFSCGM